MRLKNVREVAAWRLCTGCGACAYICPKKKIELVDVVEDGIRPVLDPAGCGDCDQCVRVCPGYETVHGGTNGGGGLISELKEAWGIVEEIWEGSAADSEIRFQGSSGGLASALALYCLEKEGMYGTVHTGIDGEMPLKNKTVLSRNREELLSRTGSRYCPASPCDGLARMENAPAPCVFIGKPCDVAGLRKSQSITAVLEGKVGIAIGIFCAGTPSTMATLDLLERLNIDPRNVEEIRYRGRGWPGSATVTLRGEKSPASEMSYMESWGFLQKYRPYRCYLCPDGTAEFADISCGDPWYRTIQAGEQGHSMALVRTQRGREILHGAMEAGYVSLRRADPKILLDSQKNLLEKRRAVWGRLATLRTFAIPAPRFGGFPLFKNWCGLPIKEKIRSVAGTARRIIQRGYNREQTFYH